MMKRSGRLIYLIHRHQASHLHYDLRLEMDGALKSWAVPKVPARKRGIKRLAIRVEDHKLGYEKFEGTIPEGQYGQGAVKIWDKGRYTPLEVKRNKIIFDIHGRKLKGTYCLVKFKPRSEKAKDSGKNWLFFKK